MKIPTKQEALIQLVKTSIGKTLSKKELDLLSQSLKVISFNKGETIYKQGFNISAYAVLLSGLCKNTVEHEVSSGGTIISLLKPVNMIGVFSLDDEVFQATASALSDSVVAFIDKKDFATVVTSNGQCAYALFEYLCTFTTKFVRQVVDFGQKSIKSRVASSLLYMTDLVKDNGTEGYLSILREFIANIKQKHNYLENIYFFTNQVLALLFTELGQVDIISECEKIYSVSKGVRAGEDENVTVKVTNWLSSCLSKCW